MPAQLIRKVRLKRSELEQRPWYVAPEKPRARLIWELDREVSRVVRRRDGRCVTCGTRKNLTCSHYFKRGFMTTRFDLRNCNTQCKFCNKRHNTNPFPYRAYMVKKYGEDGIAELLALRDSKTKVESWQMAELLEELKKAA